MPNQVKKSLVLSIYFALAVAALLVFWQVRNFDFVDYDDDVYVSENPRVLNGLTADAVSWAFTTDRSANWHPLTWLSLMLDCQLFGPSPGRMHVVNMLLHLVNTLLLFAVLKKMTGSLWPSAFVAAAFALHPMHVESVAWIAERKDVLSTLFLLLTLAAYVGYTNRPSVFRYIAALALFALGLMAKPMLVTLPFLLLLLDYWPLNRLMPQTVTPSGRRQRKPAPAADKSLTLYRIIIEKIPFFVLSAISSVITFLVQRNSGAVSDIDILSLNNRIANIFLSYARYIAKMFYPQKLAVVYPFDAAYIPFWQVALCALLLLGISFFVVRFGRKQKYLPVGWFWFVGTLIPVIGIVQVGSQAYADRYTYIPYIGLFIMLAWALSQFLSSWPQRKIVLSLLMVIVLTTLAIIAHRQVSFWNNSLTLFSHALQVTQDNCITYNHLGVTYGNLNRSQQAIEAFSQAIKLKPDYADAYYNLGRLLGKLNRSADAVNAYKQAIKIKPDLAIAYNNLGAVYTKLGRYTDAIDAHKQAIKIKPDLAEAYNNLGASYIDLSRYTEAIDVYKQAVKISPDLAEAHFNLGVAYGKLGRCEEEIEAYKKAVSVKPDFAEAYYSLGNAYGEIGRGTEAIDAYKQAVKIRPDYAEAYTNLGIVYGRLGRYTDAIEAHKQAVKIKPDYAEAYYNLGRVFGNLSRWQDAIDAYKQAVKIRPDLAEAHNNLGFAYLAIGDKNSALAEYNILKSLNSPFADNLFNQINK